MLSLLRKDAKIFENHLNPVRLVFFNGKLSLSTQISTHVSRFQSFFRLFASFCIGQISRHQHKGCLTFNTWCFYLIPTLLKRWQCYIKLARLASIVIMIEIPSSESLLLLLSLYIQHCTSTTFRFTFGDLRYLSAFLEPRRTETKITIVKSSCST